MSTITVEDIYPAREYPTPKMSSSASFELEEPEFNNPTEPTPRKVEFYETPSILTDKPSSRELIHDCSQYETEIDADERERIVQQAHNYVFTRLLEIEYIQPGENIILDISDKEAVKIALADAWRQKERGK